MRTLFTYCLTGYKKGSMECMVLQVKPIFDFRLDFVKTLIKQPILMLKMEQVNEKRVFCKSASTAALVTTHLYYKNIPRVNGFH